MRRRKIVGIGTVVVVLFVFGFSQLQAQDQVVTWREQIAQVLEIVIDIQSGVQNLTDNAVSRHEAQALETRIEVLERIVVPTATPTVTPYQDVKNQAEQSLHRESVLFLHQQDIAVFDDDEKLVSADDYVDDVVNTVVILAKWCEISVYEMVKLIDIEAKQLESERDGRTHKNGKPFMMRQYVARLWMFVDDKGFCQG